jgi:ribosomal protein S18 acetylase RimI-like enzyme
VRPAGILKGIAGGCWVGGRYAAVSCDDDRQGADTFRAAAVTISIRRASTADAPALARLCRYVHDLHATERPDVFRPFDLTMATAHFADVISSGTQRVLIAEMAGGPVGYAALLVRERPENALCFGRRWLEIDSVSVHPDHRRGGVATSLFERAEAIAREEGLAVELNTWSFNVGARAAFEAMGFRAQTSRLELRPPDSGR